VLTSRRAPSLLVCCLPEVLCSTAAIPDRLLRSAHFVSLVSSAEVSNRISLSRYHARRDVSRSRGVVVGCARQPSLCTAVSSRISWCRLSLRVILITPRVRDVVTLVGRSAGLRMCER
jgi:hypothetical protein